MWLAPRLVAFASLALVLSSAAASAIDEPARAARWEELRGAIFGQRPVADGTGMISLTAPERAEDAAAVPVKIGLGDELRNNIRELYLVIDENPSPLAGRFSFGPAAEPREIATRVRVDDYTYLHAIAETEDGRLYAVSRFIKAAGGCSAPGGKDQELAMKRLGRMKMKFAGTPELGKPLEAQLLVSHPNNSGMQMDQLTRHYVPADFVRSIKLSYNGVDVLTVESDISISEDPSLTFTFVPTMPDGEIRSEVNDSSNRYFEQSWPVRVGSGS